MTQIWPHCDDRFPGGLRRSSVERPLVGGEKQVTLLAVEPAGPML